MRDNFGLDSQSPYSKLFSELRRKRGLCPFHGTAHWQQEHRERYAEASVATYLLTWNPNKWPWEDLNDAIALTRSGKQYRARWNVHAHKQITAGDRVFLLRQRSPPKGVVASGVIVNGPYLGKHWDPEKQDRDAYHVDVDFDTILDPAEDEVFPRDALFEPGLKAGVWDTQSSGVQLPPETVGNFEQAWQDWVHKVRNGETGITGPVLTHGPEKMSAETARRAALAAIKRALGNSDFEMIAGHMKPKTETLPTLLNEATGFWKNRGDYSKPRRWLFHILDHAGKTYVVFPPFPSFQTIGAISAVSANAKKTVLTFRLAPLFRTEKEAATGVLKYAEGDSKAKETAFTLYPEWEWLLWVVLSKPLSRSIGNSAIVKNLDLHAQRVLIGGKPHNALAAGVVGLVDPEDTANVAGFPTALRFGDVTSELVSLLKAPKQFTSAVSEQEAQQPAIVTPAPGEGAPQ
jgi:hypothetical protein